MDNQHRKISGYRELTQEEIDLMNRIKAFGPELEKLCEDVLDHIDRQYQTAQMMELDDGIQRLFDADPHEWLMDGKKDLQKGLMFLTRAVAQPSFF